MIADVGLLSFAPVRS